MRLARWYRPLSPTNALQRITHVFGGQCRQLTFRDGKPAARSKAIRRRVAREVAGLDRTRELAAFDPTATNGLRVRSQVMADKPVTIRRERVGRRIGHLDDQDIARLNVAADGGPAGTPGASFSCVTVRAAGGVTTREPYLQSPDPGKGPRNYSFGSQRRTFELSQMRTSELGCYSPCLSNIHKTCSLQSGNVVLKKLPRSSGRGRI